MRNENGRRLLSLVSAGMLGLALVAGPQPSAFAQRAKEAGKDSQQSAPTIDAATGKVLNEAIELLNMEKYDEAMAKINTLHFDRLSPYERSKVEQILFNITYTQGKYADARQHLKAAIDAGGLNEQEVSAARYQFAQLYMTEEKWKEGAAALEDWFKTAQNPNSAAYYLLAVAYYEMNDMTKALPPAKKAVEIMDKPQEQWIVLLLSLYMQKDQFKQAIPLVERLISIAPQKKTYWLQLSSIYGQLEDYPHALGVMQLAYDAGLVTEDADIRRLADLLLFNEVPYRGAEVLEKAIADKHVTLDDKLYEKLGNCWVAAGEYDKAVAPLQKAGELSSNGDLYVRLGEVQIQREDWAGAAQALEKGLDKGKLRDAPNAQMLMGISLYNQDKYDDADKWFERCEKSDKYSKTCRQYLSAIKAKRS
jgi:tetratricopeptide (TPR) repeat protein